MKTFLAKIWRVLHLPKNLQLWVMRLIQNQFLIGVTGIIFNDKQEILVFRHTYRQTQWSLPGGYLKAKEHPMEGLEREIKEESGLVVSVDSQLKTRTDRETARLDMCYVGKFMGGEFKPTHEVSEHGFFAFDDLPLIAANQLYLIELAINKNKEVEENEDMQRPSSFIDRLKFVLGSK